MLLGPGLEKFAAPVAKRRLQSEVGRGCDSQSPAGCRASEENVQVTLAEDVAEADLVKEEELLLPSVVLSQHEESPRGEEPRDAGAGARRGIR
jgi:hypothetical protein